MLQIEVEEKTNEIPMALIFLPALPVAGRVLTADALHTHVPFFLRVQQLEGDAVLVVKDNQPTLHEHLATYFADPLASFEEAETIDLQRGRREVRSHQGDFSSFGLSAARLAWCGPGGSTHPHRHHQKDWQDQL